MRRVDARVVKAISCLAFLAGFAILQVVGQQASKNPPPSASEQTQTGSTQNCPEADQLRKNVQQLNGEIQRLKRRVAELEKDRLATTIQEQLEKEEQRGEALQLHLFEISEKEAPLQARIEQINQQLRPETLERTMAGVGSVHPEDARDEVRRRLTNEKQRLQAQLDLLRQDRVRTQASLATTDAAIQRLKQKLAEALR
jgi:chromosome segregation ATPase